MECNSPTRSANALARQVTAYDPGTGCSVVQIEEDGLGDAVDCSRWTSLTMLLASLNEANRTIRVNLTNIVEADLCGTYTPRVTCDRMASLPELLAEAATMGTVPICIVVSGAGEAAVNGTYCPHPTDANVWTLEGGTHYEDSIYPEGDFGQYCIISGGTYAADPQNVKYVTFGVPGGVDPWFPFVGFGPGGALPAPTLSAAYSTAVVLRVAFVTDATLGCEDCTNPLSGVVEAIGSTFVTDGTDTYILAAAASGTHALLDCDTAGISELHLVRGAIAPVGDCGLMAWRTDIP